MKPASKISWFNSAALPLLAAALIGIPECAAGGVIEPGLMSRIEGGGADTEHRVIVKLRGAVDYAQLAASLRGMERRERIRTAAQNVRKQMERSHPAFRDRIAVEELQGRVKNVKSLWITNSMSLTAGADQIRTLADLPDVAEIVQDRVITLGTQTAAAGAETTTGWNISRIGAVSLWNAGYTGTGVVIASLDTGVDVAHPDIGPQWRGGSNSWFDPNGEHPAPADIVIGPVSGHGTQTMGIMVGSTTGVAPGAHWIASKIFNDSGQALASNVHLAFQWLLDPDADPTTDDAPDVVNCSWDLENPGAVNEEFRPDVQALRTAGIIVVFSAGNAGPSMNTSLSPANYPESLSVGMTDGTDAIAFSSSRGPSAWDGTSIYPLLTAPGIGIPTTDLMLGLPAPQYLSVSGTSFSAPHVTGAIAVLLSSMPTLAPEQIDEALTNSAWDLGATGPDTAYGYGFLDVERAARYLNILPALVAGDVNGNGFLDLGDILAVLRTALGMQPSAVEAMRARAGADVFPMISDGTITTGDALTLLKTFVGAQ